MHQRALRLAASVALALIAACGDSSGPTDFNNSAFVGTWQVDVPASAGCWTAFAVRFTVDQDDAAASAPENDLINIVSTWWVTSDPSNSALFSGSFDWGRGEFDLVFYIGASSSLRFQGKSPNPTKVTGTFSDRDGAVFSAGCSATATGTHQ